MENEYLLKILEISSDVGLITKIVGLLFTFPICTIVLEFLSVYNVYNTKTLL